MGSRRARGAVHREPPRASRHPPARAGVRKRDRVRSRRGVQSGRGADDIRDGPGGPLDALESTVELPRGRRGAPPEKQRRTRRARPAHVRFRRTRRAAYGHAAAERHGRALVPTELRGRTSLRRQRRFRVQVRRGQEGWSGGGAAQSSGAVLAASTQARRRTQAAASRRDPRRVRTHAAAEEVLSRAFRAQLQIPQAWMQRRSRVGQLQQRDDGSAQVLPAPVSARRRRGSFRRAASPSKAARANHRHDRATRGKLGKVAAPRQAVAETQSRGSSRADLQPDDSSA
mmetsp:Transcript_11992/g.51462  ORF Transcript_11992/g.51462 Transcript_11992/m.51462 type:complete len:286 (+) Transcript_11992:157-1014(+)